MKRKVLGIKSVNADAVDQVLLQAKSNLQIQVAHDEAEVLVRQRHHILLSEQNDFSIRNIQEIFAAQETSSHIVVVILAAVAYVSLVAGDL